MKKILDLGYSVGVSEETAKTTLIGFRKINRHLPLETITPFVLDTLSGVLVKVIETKTIRHMTKEVGSKKIALDILERMFKEYFAAGVLVHIFTTNQAQNIMTKNLRHNINTETGFQFQYIEKNGKKVYSLKAQDWISLS